MKSRVLFPLLVLCTLSVSPSTQGATLTSGSIDRALHSAGYEETRTCLRDGADYGIRRIWTVQYRSRTDQRTEAGALMGALVDQLDPKARFLAFAPKRRWSDCSERGKQFVFWRDEDSSWRLIQGKPVEYLLRQYDRLTPQQQQSSSGAYVLFSLATTQHGAQKLDDAIASYEKILQLLEGQPNSETRILTLYQLSQLFIQRNDDAQATAYLQKYALATSNVIDEIDYQPIRKTAPQYPARALRKFDGGSVLLSFDVNTSGKTENIEVLTESPAGHGFGKAAAKAVESFRYVPSVKDGSLVAAHGVQNLIEFSVEWRPAGARPR